jgi:hypothetical protein
MCDMCENCCEAFVGTYEGYYVSKDDKKMRVCRCCKNEYVMMGWIGIKVEELDMKLAMNVIAMTTTTNMTTTKMKTQKLNLVLVVVDTLVVVVKKVLLLIMASMTTTNNQKK